MSNGSVTCWGENSKGQLGQGSRSAIPLTNEMHVGPRRCLAEYCAPYGWFEGRIHIDAVDLDVDGMFGVRVR